jgi:prepilin-type N-terminal cleavage/methylation domain-containing protein
MTRHTTRHSNGFSLIEVLIATIVLALGMLGLSALFAGAAVQQQRSAEITDSVIFAANVEALLRSKLGSASLNTPFNPNLHTKWDVLYSFRNGQEYKLVGKTDSTKLDLIYKSQRATGQSMLNGNLPTVQSATGAKDPAIKSYTQSLEFQVDPKTIQATIKFSAGMGATNPPTDLLLSTAVVQPFATGSNIDSVPMNRYLLGLDPNFPTTFYLYENPGAIFVDNLGKPVLRPTGADDLNATYMHIDMSSGQTKITEFQGGSVVATIYLNNPPGTQVRISDLTFAYEAILDSLLSLNNRLKYTSDDRAPSGRRPAQGASVLARINPDEKNIGMIILTYALKPTGAIRNNPNEFAFVPPDLQSDISSNTGILREIAVTLGFDTTSERYYITANLESDEALLNAGQWFVMSSDVGVAVGGSTAGIFGADLPAKIARVISFRPQGAGTSQVRAYFDVGESPRYKSRSPMPCQFQPTCVTTIYGWVIAPTVVSGGPDASTWIVEPREARVLTFPIVN